jgi:hypothetical protein
MATPRVVHDSEGTGISAGQKTTSGHPNGIPVPHEVRKEAIQLQLDRILTSSSFKHSRRHTQFLRFVVEKALSGEISDIKERLIGIEIFDRPADYDLSTDPIVRGAAVELRKRIAQYYAEPNHAGELRVELPIGTYVPVFHWPNPLHSEQDSLTVSEPTKEKESATPLTASPLDPHEQTLTRWSWKTRAIIAACAIVLAAVGIAFIRFNMKALSPTRSLDAFWAPLLNETDSVTVCVGDLNYFFKTPPVSEIPQLHLRADNLLNPNVGAALLRVGTILGARGKRSTLRLADLTELNDLRQQPVIFIGGMNNPWTRRILDNLRFRMTSKPGGIGGDYELVVDQENPSMANWRVDMLAPVDSIQRDYSLVTRMNDSLTGEPIIILSGLGPYGTSAASEFVSNPDYFSQFSKQAPKGWENRNIQIVLETIVVNGRVSVPRVVAEQVY